MAHANLCSSPPDSSSILRLRIFWRSEFNQQNVGQAIPDNWKVPNKIVVPTQKVANLILILAFIFLVQQLLDRTFDSFGNLIHILRLDKGFQIIFKNLGEVILKLGTSEMVQNFLPIRGTLIKNLKTVK